MTYQTILVPLDGSKLAERALPYAAQLAKASSGHLLLVRGVLARVVPGVDPTDAQVAVTQQAESENSAVAERLRQAGVDAESIVYYDEAANAILDAARHRHADLIVMSTHGRTGVGRWIYGSVADQVLRRAEVPVLLIPAAVDRAWTPERKHRIVVPLDGSDLAKGALGPAADLARLLGAELLLVQVVELTTTVYPEGYIYAQIDVDAELAGATRYLEAIANQLRTTGLAVDVMSRLGIAASEIAALARERDADLIVMATHGRGGLARLVMGSVATGVLQRSTVPVMLVRPAALREETLERASPATGTTLVIGRCYFCKRPYYGDLTAVPADARCLRCGFHLHACGNCFYFDSIGCVLQRPEANETVPGQHCPVFAFRWEKVVATAETPTEVSVQAESAG